MRFFKTKQAPASVKKVVDIHESGDFADRVRFCAERLAEEGVCALGGLYDATASRLVRYASTLTRQRDDAEDAVQAALVRIALRPGLLARARYPWAYLLKITRNEALNIVRRRRPIRPLTRPDARVWSDPPTHGEEEIHQLVRLALRKLPTTQAEVVVLKIWEEMTFAEVGEILGQSPNTAASRYRYALQKLSQHLHSVVEEVRNA
ncbi:MAG TPA: sigma-70 family RNA polymerase sigma factor [Planctomycetaceae bacterium]|nr:sigma-70 family RNA polymerase sigma factor [Planctomycetaceae bacterium]